ncbi:hypothetical protein XENORESO_007084, partial [Xenotaenia resolanae]
QVLLDVGELLVPLPHLRAVVAVQVVLNHPLMVRLSDASLKVCSGCGVEALTA